MPVHGFDPSQSGTMALVVSRHKMQLGPWTQKEIIIAVNVPDTFSVPSYCGELAEPD